MEQQTIKAYKAFSKNLTCRGFQYEVGKEYETNKAKLCEEGFHACESPIDVFNYYSPADSRFCLVELSGEIDNSSEDSKIAATKIKICKEISLAELINASVELNKSHSAKETTTQGNFAHATTQGYNSHAITQGDFAHATTQGNFAHATTQGYNSHAITQGDYSHAITQGDGAHATTQGNFAHATTQGYNSHAITQGDGAHATTQGDYSHAITQGYGAHATTQGYGAHATTQGYNSHAITQGDGAHAITQGYNSHATTQGDYSHASVKGRNSIAAALGVDSQASAPIGGAIVVAEYGKFNGICNPLIGIKSAIVDGITLKPDTFYCLKNGEFQEVPDKGAV